MALPELTSDLGSAVLATAMNATTTSMTVVSTATLPTGTGQFRVLVDGELMTVLSPPSGTTYTVVRASEGPNAAAPHQISASIKHVLTAASLANLTALPTATQFLGDSLTWGLTTLFNGNVTTATVTIAGAAVGDLVHVAPPATCPPGLSFSDSFVSSANTVTLVAQNGSGADANIPVAHSDVYKVRIYP